ncbi:helix-turn-helix domain-containing protein [Actinomadura fulvescens]|uniref:Winged helix-turn-helix transcriptional regulator n=1 Tax=Actinomadura fulvescens TaxID=46160 RepID=A0ABN3PQ82_9ACTN
MARKRSYGQYCGLAHALELVGERWALLVIRDLVLGPKRFTDLRIGLPRIPTNVLSSRLKELEQAGVVRRRTLPRPAASVIYELTDYGAELEDIVLRLGRWGAQTLGDPAPEDIVTPDGEVLALRATFRPEAARGVHARFELHVGDVTVHAIVDDGVLTAGEGPLPEPGLVIVIAEISALKPLLTREVGAAEAVASGFAELTGDPAEFEKFVELFSVAPTPADVGQVA